MEEADLGKVADALRAKVEKKKTSETGSQTKQRLLNAVSKRDQAIRMIEDYQDKTGIPTDDEVDGAFLGEGNLSVDALKDAKDEV
jgi:hypothetical protein